MEVELLVKTCERGQGGWGKGDKGEQGVKVVLKMGMLVGVFFQCFFFFCGGGRGARGESGLKNWKFGGKLCGD